MSKHVDLTEWISRLQRTNPFVAVMEEQPFAFCELEADGHIDFFYCHPNWQCRGAGSELLNSITAEALLLGITSFHAEVSVTAEPFFSKRGFRIIEERISIICDAPAKQYIMCKEF